MKYRKFGSLNWEVSALGFGCMRLPTVDNNPMSGNIKEDEAGRMIRRAIDQGVNYIDTAYPYHSGQSEIVVGKVLQDGYRQQVKLATKSPVWLIHQASDFDKYLNEQLTKLQTEQIDFYLLHGLDKERWEGTILKFNLLERAEAAVRDGRIGHLGFSFHDQYESFQTIVDGYDHWEFCQIQYNYMDVNNQAGTKGLQYAASKGLAVVIMEPLLGGKLANPPQTIREMFIRSGAKFSPADWALQWVWNQPEVSLLLSGMSSMNQVTENVSSADHSGINSLRGEDLKFIEELRQKYRARTAIPCTGCSYCMPCPGGVDIPGVFRFYNDGFMHEDVGTSRALYGRFLAENERAGACLQCKACEAKCPQKILVSEWMPKAHAVLAEGKPYENQKG
ncbi:MAG TPA: aldo/keto reductase [Firmicutes bacterium]|nr:aldo/keto reductase [Bacillota bacterium]